MSDHAADSAAEGSASEASTSEASGSVVPVEPFRERVGLGLLGAFGGVVLGAVLSVVVWNLGFIASITSFVLAAAAVFFYGQLAGTAPRKGLVPLVLLIVAGVMATFFVMVGYDAATAYDQLTLQQGPAPISKSEFVRSTITDPEVLKAYSTDMLFFFGFAVLGMYSTIKRLLSQA